MELHIVHNGKSRLFFLYNGKKEIGQGFKYIQDDNNISKALAKNGDKVFHFANFSSDTEKKKNELASIVAILSLTPSEIPNNLYIESICFPIVEDNKVNIEVYKRDDLLYIHYTRFHDLGYWEHPFSPSTFNTYLLNNFNSSDPYISPLNNVAVNITKTIDANNDTTKTIDELTNIYNTLNEYYEESLIKLANEKFHDSLVKLFEFPPEYANICSQYLMWFGEFLKNLGIEADVHTEPRNGQTALIVSPKDNPELLDEIEKLFYQYLALPYAELLPASKQTPQEMYAYQSAMNQIDNLKNQIQMKDSMLQLQQATNTALTEKLTLQANKPLLLESLQDEKKYELFDGLISIPAKQEFGKNKNISFNFEKLFSKKQQNDKDD